MFNMLFPLASHEPNSNFEVLLQCSRHFFNNTGRSSCNVFLEIEHCFWDLVLHLVFYKTQKKGSHMGYIRRLCRQFIWSTLQIQMFGSFCSKHFSTRNTPYNGALPAKNPVKRGNEPVWKRHKTLTFFCTCLQWECPLQSERVYPRTTRYNAPNHNVLKSPWDFQNSS